MANALAYIGGGLLQGLGRGMELQGAAMREAARDELRHRRDMERDDTRYGREREMADTRFGREREMAAEERGWRTGEREAGQEFEGQQGLLSHQRQTGREAEERDWRTGEREAGQRFEARQGLRGHRREREIEEIKARGRGGAKKDPGKALENVREVFGETDDLGNKVIPSGRVEAAAGYLERSGFPEEAAAMRENARLAQGDVLLEEARGEASRRADERSSIFSPRSREFPETGGDREAWERSETQRIMAGDGGRAPRDEGRPVEAGETERRGGPGRRPTSSSAAQIGSRENPYRLQSPDDLKNVPKGAWLVTEDGRLGRKT